MSGRKSLLRIIAEPIVVACVLALAVRAVARIYSVPSASMSPTLRPGDHIVVTRYLSDRPSRGDVVVFHHPAGRDLTVKRIVAIPGDLVEYRDGRMLVPAGHLFVLGDNRTDSWDSRHWGPLPDSLVVGRARLVLIGPDSDEKRARFARIFKWIE